MISREMLVALKFIQHKLKDEKLKWVVIGSANQALQGINLAPRDLDIITSIRDIKKFLTIFREYVEQGLHKKAPLTKGYPDCLRLILRINNVQVDIIGEEDYDIYFSKILKGAITNVQAEGLTIPCFKLEAELRAYEETNKTERAILIEEYLNQQKR